MPQMQREEGFGFSSKMHLDMCDLTAFFFEDSFSSCARCMPILHKDMIF